MSQTYTLKEVAALLVRTGDANDTQRVARQIRHWTLCDVLETTSRKHTGTGTSRRYAGDEVRIAALLVVLTKYGMTMTELEHFRELNESVLEAWHKHQSRRKDLGDLFWEITWNDQLFRGKISEGAPEMLTRGAKKLSNRKSAGMDARDRKLDPANTAHAIAINVSKIFDRLDLED